MSDAFQFGLKTAEIMLPGNYASGRNAGLSGLSSSPVVPPLTGPLQDDLSPGAFSAAVAKSMTPDPRTGANPSMRLTDAEIAAGRAALPKPGLFSRLASGAKNFYEWGKTPIGATQYAKEKGLTDLPYAQQEQAWRKTQPFGNPADFKKEYAATLAEYFNKSPRNSLRNSPLDRTARTLLAPARLLYNGYRGADSAANATSDLLDGSWKDWEILQKPKQVVNNASAAVDDIKKLTGRAVDATSQSPADPAAMEAAKNTPAPTMGNYLADSFKQNPLLWGLPAAGLGGLGAYGLYKALQARRDAKKRRRLMAPAAITY